MKIISAEVLFIFNLHTKVVQAKLIPKDIIDFFKYTLAYTLLCI